MTDLQKQWYEQGENYAKAVNEMVAYAKQHGWDNYKGEEPEDNRNNLAQAVFDALKKANLENKVNEFRNEFPPAHIPFVPMLEEKSQEIRLINIIDEKRVVFFAGSSWGDYKVYLIDEHKITELDNNITAIGKAKKGNVFAIAFDDKILIKDHWDGDNLKTFKRKVTTGFNITNIIPFNNGEKALLISDNGIYLISENEEKLLKYGLSDDSDYNGLSMEHGTLSHDNRYIAVGDQCSNHAILDNNGEMIDDFYPMSSYPHFCEFSKDDKQLIVNSCHFYDGVTNGIDMQNFKTLDKEEDLPIIDEIMRVYAGVAVEDYYILGDAYGYIRAVDKTGKELWQHFLGSTISGMAISDDNKTLWVGAYSGFLHKLSLGKGHRDTHTIGTGDLFEEFRLIVWEDEEQIWRW